VACRELIAALDDHERFPGLGGADRETMREGALLAAGICESFYADGSGAVFAEQLEVGLSHVGQLGAHRVQLVRHLMRGERQLAEQHRRAMELLSLQAGVSTWQVELWSAAMESMVTLLTEDHLQAKQLIEVFRDLVPGAPSLAVYAEMLRARVDRRLGELVSARTRIAAVCERLQPRQHVGWDAARYTLGDVLMLSGDVDGALRVAREALSGYSEHQDLHVVRIMLCRLEAVALCRLGEVAQARQRLDGLIALVTPTGHPLLISRLHEAAFEVALEQGARDAALEHLSEMEAAIEPTGSPALLALLHSAVQSAREAGLTGRSLGSSPPLESEAATVVTAVSSAAFRRRRPTPPVQS
jgi:ATP/maltotriose-dependent transcriptional regulator MalT